MIALSFVSKWFTRYPKNDFHGEQSDVPRLKGMYSPLAQCSRLECRIFNKFPWI